MMIRTARHLYLPLLITCILLSASNVKAAAPPPALPEDKSAAVIFVYQRIGEPTATDGNISTEKFMAHLEEIQNGNYNVLALPDLVAALKRGDDLPPRTIAITFEGGYKSTLDTAVPALIENEIPFTVFYSANNADMDSSEYMNWSDLISLSSNPDVTLGVLPASFIHLDSTSEVEMRRQINKAKMRHREMIENEAKLYSYPYGEYSALHKKIIEESGFTAAFGQNSGAVYAGSDFFSLPRFTLTDEYGDTTRFRNAAETLPFPVHDVEPSETRLPTDTLSVGFSVPDALADTLNSLSCFETGQITPEIHVLGSRVEIRPKQKDFSDRLRINCTLPGPSDPEDDTPRWRWLGFLFTTNNEDASDKDNKEISQQQTALP